MSQTFLIYQRRVFVDHFFCLRITLKKSSFFLRIALILMNFILFKFLSKFMQCLTRCFFYHICNNCCRERFHDDFFAIFDYFDWIVGYLSEIYFYRFYCYFVFVFCYFKKKLFWCLFCLVKFLRFTNVITTQNCKKKVHNWMIK